MDGACADADIARFQDLNVRFHAAVVSAADNRRLEEIYRGLGKETRLFRRRGLVTDSAMASSNLEHRFIVSAIESRDAARAAAAMEDHILQGKARFLSATLNELER